MRATALTRYPHPGRAAWYGVLLVPFLGGAWLLGNGAWIHAKAITAQILLRAAWARTLHGEEEVKPWPWADTWPVGRLNVPRLGVSRIVLAGVSGSALAFGPGHLFFSAAPGEAGNVVIAGHRDTHFRFLEQLRDGDVIRVQAPAGGEYEYRVLYTQVIHESETSVLDPGLPGLLTLVTCYPFDALRAGGPLRFVAVARRIDDSPRA